MIREAVPSDAKQLSKVHVDVWRSAYKNIIPSNVLDGLSYQEREERWRKNLEVKPPGTQTFVYEDKNEVIGFVTVGPVRNENFGYDGEMWALYLASEYQGKGIGKFLFNHGVYYLRLNRFKSMLVWVLKDNKTVDFYKAMGGTYVSRKQIEIGIYLDEISYGWQLDTLP